MDAVDLAYRKLYTLGAMFTLGATGFTMLASDETYTGWQVFYVMLLGSVGWPIMWGAIIANILNTYVGG